MKQNPSLKYFNSFKTTENGNIIPLNELINPPPDIINPIITKSQGIERQFMTMNEPKIIRKKYKKTQVKNTQKPPVNPAFNFITTKKKLIHRKSSSLSSSGGFDSLKAKFLNEIISRKLLDGDFEKSHKFYHPLDKSRFLKHKMNVKTLKSLGVNRGMTCPSSTVSICQNSSLAPSQDSRASSPLNINQIALKKQNISTFKKMRILKLKNLEDSRSRSRIQSLKRKLRLFGETNKCDKTEHAGLKILKNKQKYFMKRNLRNGSNISLRGRRYSTLQGNE
ncbi:unnamed protein product [Moneuplotes crassus]|uniref:Uncharacterized protein n=1 Tax=Euplotes crassus TaxID=5936 RepID=A0AAD1UPB2_EUPCR|nr:unnamed protein product [Moneuplotes crassus]